MRRRGLARAAVAAVVLALAGGALSPPTHEPVRHRSNHLTGSGWSFSYKRSATDALVVSDAAYRGRPVFRRVSVPQCRVVYAQGAWTMNDQMGHRGNIQYVAGSTVLVRSREAIEIRAMYQCCGWPAANSYRYRIRYIFYSDGRFRPFVYVYGPGIEPRARYECAVRMDLDVAGRMNDYFQQYRDELWVAPDVEREVRDEGTTDPLTGAEWIVWDASGYAYYLRPNPVDGRPRAWILRARDDEGNTDLGLDVIDPARFDDDEPVQGTDVVFWYLTMAPYRRPSGCVGRASRCTPIRLGPSLVPSIAWG